MRGIKNAIIISIALSSTPAAWASDAFADAYDDAPGARVARGSGTAPSALTPDARDDSGLSARAFQGEGAERTSTYALALDAHDDSGLSARERELAEEGTSAVVVRPSEPAKERHACTCMG